MITIDCKEVSSIKNELLVHVSDDVEAIPILKHHQFTLSPFDDDEVLDTNLVITSIKKFLNSIGEGSNFAVISNNDTINIKALSDKVIKRDAAPQSNMFSCTHCGFMTRYETELNVHMRIHYL